MSTEAHWQAVYQAKTPEQLTWFAAHLAESLRMISDVSSPSARVLDVGGGASTLVDDLLERGYRDVTVLDVSAAALAASRQRLGDRGNSVRFIASDVTTVELEKNRFDVWHDRAVFHFLTVAAERQAYIERLRRSLVAGGHVVIGTFSMTGPSRCSGLDVIQYDAEKLAAELGGDFVLTAEHAATHVTPAGREQEFLFCCFKKRG